MWRDALAMAAKDLRIERRSRVGLNQVAPFALLVLVLFAFALDPDRGVLKRAAPGLFWLAVLFAALLIIQRSFSLESPVGVRDGLRLSGLDSAGIFLGKAGAVAVQLLALQVLLLLGVTVLYDLHPQGAAVLVLTSLLATAGIAVAGSVYGVLAAGLRVRDTLVPLLVLPVIAPVLLAATRASEAALDRASSDAWPWISVLAAFSVAYAAFGIIAFGPLLEES